MKPPLVFHASLKASTVEYFFCSMLTSARLQAFWLPFNVGTTLGMSS